MLSTLIIGSCIIFFCFVGRADYASRKLAPFWARLNSFVSLIKVHVLGRGQLKKNQPYVIAANHLSMVDIYLIYGFTNLNIKWVMKNEIKKIPVLGLACKLMGHIYIDRSSTEHALASIHAAKKHIRQDTCIVFFPEGTRSRTSEVLPFKKGAFKLAKDLALPIIPVSIKNTDRIVPSDTMDWRPGSVSLTFHKPIEVANTADTVQLANQTRETIIKALKSPETQYTATEYSRS